MEVTERHHFISEATVSLFGGLNQQSQYEQKRPLFGGGNHNAKNEPPHFQLNFAGLREFQQRIKLMSGNGLRFGLTH
jgi:hypothetical protein